MRTCYMCAEPSLRSRCKPCNSEYQREYHRNNPDKKRGYNLRRYGIGPLDYDALLEAQAGLCAICFRAEGRIDPRTEQPRNLAVDHDHATGQVRGLLCMDCNRFLGLAGDSADRLRSAAAYLDRSL